MNNIQEEQFLQIPVLLYILIKNKIKYDILL